MVKIKCDGIDSWRLNGKLIYLETFNGFDQNMERIDMSVINKAPPPPPLLT